MSYENLTDRELQLALHRETMGALAGLGERLLRLEAATGRIEVEGAKRARDAAITAQRVDALITEGRKHGAALRSLDTHARSNLLLARERVKDLESRVDECERKIAAAG